MKQRESKAASEFSGSCPGCGAAGPHAVFYEQQGIPVHSCLMMETREEARAFPKGDLRLAFCGACGFIWNVAFVPAHMRYLGEDSSRYEETQCFSPRFRRFQTALVDRLIERYDLRGRQILEIGCGKGDFLVELCERGGNSGVGLDPAYRPERTASEAASRIRFLRELYSEAQADLAGDFVACRHTLEHIPEPSRFVELVRRSLHARRDVTVFFELPDVERVLEEQAFWDIYYEHCSYFSPGSLGRLFRRCGFEVLELSKDYDDQYLLIEARPATSPPREPHPSEEPLEELETEVHRFSERVASRQASLKEALQEAVRAGKEPILWGSGSKAVAYLSTLGIGEEIPCVVDINPHRHGKFLAGTGHEIVSPEALRVLQPDLVIAMNPVYVNEICADLGRLGVAAEVVAL
ncbi:MAG: class I SAM-dependent methyltransferase [Planctomycetota bacterium]